MALLEKLLEVKPSAIPSSGNGLFTTVAIPRGTRIVEYKGRITTWKEVKHDWSNAYLYTLKANHVIDARDYKKSPARYINDAKGLTKIKGLQNNCEFMNDGLRVFVVALRDINPGEEIMASYGKAYWDVVKANRKLDGQKPFSHTHLEAKTSFKQRGLKNRKLI